MQTAATIMNELERMAAEKGVLDPNLLLLGATKLSALLQSEEEELAELEHRLIKMKAAYIQDGKPANQAKLLVEADDLYLVVMKKRAFIKRCDETIKLAKKWATVTSDMTRYA